MYSTVTRSMFHDAFKNYDRLDNFSYEARNALFDYLEDYEKNSSDMLELDIIALCCEYREDKIEDVLKDYSLESLEELKDQTYVIWRDDKNILFQVY